MIGSLPLILFARDLDGDFTAPGFGGDLERVTGYAEPPPLDRCAKHLHPDEPTVSHGLCQIPAVDRPQSNIAGAERMVDWRTSASNRPFHRSRAAERDHRNVLDVTQQKSSRRNWSTSGSSTRSGA